VTYFKRKDTNYKLGRHRGQTH